MEKDEPWHKENVSWFQFIIGIVLAIIGIEASLFLDRMGVDHRVTIVEERQNINTKAIADQNNWFIKSQMAQDDKFQKMQEELMSKLDGIRESVTGMRLILAAKGFKVDR